jgi:hypothetical protein
VARILTDYGSSAERFAASRGPSLALRRFQDPGGLYDDKSNRSIGRARALRAAGHGSNAAATRAANAGATPIVTTGNSGPAITGARTTTSARATTGAAGVLSIPATRADAAVPSVLSVPGSKPATSSAAVRPGKSCRRRAFGPLAYRRRLVRPRGPHFRLPAGRIFGRRRRERGARQR